MKKFGMLLMAFVVMLFMTVATVNATEEEEALPALTGVSLSAEGVLTCDEFEGADGYWLGLNQQSRGFGRGDSIVLELENLCTDTYMSPYCQAGDPNRYFLDFSAVKDGQTISATYYGFVSFDGSTFTLTPASENHYILIFNSNGGSGKDPMFIPVSEPLERPQPPEKEGTTFLGWYKDSELTQKFDFSPASMEHYYQVLYAKWGEPVVIDEAEFRGVVAPVAGEHPGTELFRTITTPTEGLRVIYAAWLNESTGDELTASDTFVKGQKYVLSIVIEPDDGYAIKDEENFWFEDHATLNVEPIGGMTSRYVKERGEFQFTYEAKEATSTDPTPTDPTPTDPTPTDPTPTDPTPTDPTPTDPTPTDPEPVVVAAPNLDGFTVSAGAGKVKLSWNKVDDAKGYYVYQGTSKKKLTKVATITKNTTLTYTKKKLKANTTYYYKVVAYKTVKKKNKNIVTSKVLSAKTAPATPKVTIATKNGESLKLTVKSVKGATRYEIYRSNKKDGEYFIEGELTKAGKFTNKGLDLNKTYYYKVRACNKSACSGWSKVVSKKVTMSAPTFKVKSTAKKQVTITVTGADNVSEGGIIYRSTKKNGKYTKVVDLSEPTYVDSTKSKKTYYYKIRTVAYVNGKVVYSPYSKVIKVKSK